MTTTPILTFGDIDIDTFSKSETNSVKSNRVAFNRVYLLVPALQGRRLSSLILTYIRATVHIFGDDGVVSEINNNPEA